MELYFVSEEFYQFPLRPFPEIFSINIAFTLLGIPLFVQLYLYTISNVNKWGRAGITLFVSLLMPIFEKLSEEIGVFVHSDSWVHIYSFFGYLLFLTIISVIFRWLKKGME